MLAMDRSIDLMIRSAASNQPIWRNIISAERERCRRQILKIRDPWVLARARMIAEQLSLPVDLDP